MSEPTGVELGDEKQVPYYDPDGDMIDVGVSHENYCVKPLGYVGGVGIGRESGEPVYMQVTRISHAIREHLRTIEAMEKIRRGDVVQCIRDCVADEGDGMYAVKDVSVTDGLTPSGRLLLYGRRFDPGSFARIGRARYYPDGTPVED